MARGVQPTAASRHGEAAVGLQACSQELRTGDAVETALLRSQIHWQRRVREAYELVAERLTAEECRRFEEALNGSDWNLAQLVDHDVHRENPVHREWEAASEALRYERAVWSDSTDDDERAEAEESTEGLERAEAEESTEQGLEAYS